jgi:phosphodiesterase/alkaline phosphatase D-like protein
MLRTALSTAIILLWCGVAVVLAPCKATTTDDDYNRAINLFLESEYFPFDHGVSSADPLTDSVLLWTHISGITEPNAWIHYDIWEKDNPLQGFDSPLFSGTVVALEENDYCVTIEVQNLQASTKYLYQFRDDLGRKSRLGTTHTISLISSEVSVAIVTCTSLVTAYLTFINTWPTTQQSTLSFMLGITFTPRFMKHMIDCGYPMDCVLRV